MRILVTNDDGIFAPGLHSLIEVASQFGEVKVAAPDRERSACSHAMTLHDPLRVTEYFIDGVEALQVNGVPVDCVNVGLKELWPNGCDLVLSGFNAGPNLGFDVTYSGTVAGAMEGCINGIRSIALSMAVFVAEAPPHFETGAQWLTENWTSIVEVSMKPLTFLNINVPAIASAELSGTRVCAMGKRIYEERIEKRADPWGRPYFWQGGVVAMDVNQPGTDVEAITNGFVSITPVTLDWTDHATIERLSSVLNQ